MTTNQSGKIIKDQSNLGQFSSAIAKICEERGIDKSSVISAVEAALAAAYKKDYGKKGQIILAKIDENTSETNFKQLKEVVDESVRTIEEEYIPEEIHQVPKTARKSEEKIETRSERIIKNQSESGEEVVLPRFNSDREVLLVDAKKVVPEIKVGDFIEFPLELQDTYGRIASQTAKQVIIQKIREAERESMYKEYKGKEGEVVNGTIQRVESGKVFVDLGKSIGVLFHSEQVPGEEYNVGERLKLYISRVDSDPKSLGVVLSRRHPQLLAKLFELEVPEIFSGTVKIKAVAREAGVRSKIAVCSTEEGVDPVGSCVGQKGLRVQAVIDELNGEKIDIIEWVKDDKKMIAQALLPAKVIDVELQGGDDIVPEKEKKEGEKDNDEVNQTSGCEEEVVTDDQEGDRQAVAYVLPDQLSLAIGKHGQNVRLAAKLTGWNINVEVVEKEDDEVDEEKNADSGDESVDEKTDDVTSKKKTAVDVENEKEEKIEDKEMADEEGVEESKGGTKEDDETPEKEVSDDKEKKNED